MADHTDSSTSTPGFSRIVRFRRISKAADYTIDESPTEDELRAIARDLGILSVRKMRMQGHLAPLAKGGWDLVAHIGATVTQACVVTLEPVRTRIEEDLHRTYLPDLEDIDYEPEMEMPEDEDIEPLAQELDLGLVVLEALSLSLPDYPRIAGAEAPQTDFSATGIAPFRDEDLKPFAGLSALKEKLQDSGE